jgi:Flp pilus assembly protein TadG
LGVNPLGTVRTERSLHEPKKMDAETKAQNHKERRIASCAVRAVAGRLPVRREDGQALVEFALVLIPLVLLLFGTIEFGRAWNTKNLAVHLANEAARMAAVNQVNCTTLRNEATADGLPASTTISIGSGQVTPIQQPVTATITVPFTSSVPVIQSIFTAVSSWSGNLQGTATMRDEQPYAGGSC